MSESDREIEIQEEMLELETELVVEGGADMSSNIPKIGKWYMFLTNEANKKSRYWISPLNKSSTFVLKKRPVWTSKGEGEGLSCPIVCKRVGAAPDFRTGKVVGVYQILNTPSFARAGIKIQELRDSLQKDEIERMIDAHTYNVALRLKELLRLKNIQIASLQKTVNDFETDIIVAGTEMAGSALAVVNQGAESAGKQLMRAGKPSALIWLEENWKTIAGIGIVVVAIFVIRWLITPSIGG